jgi:hypothetical protein
MLKQQQFRPLSSEIQVFVLYNSIKERISPQQIRFYEYQVVPNLLYGLKRQNLLCAMNRPINSTTLYDLLYAITECCVQHEGPNGTVASALLEAMEREMLMKSDHLGTYLNLRAPNSATYIYGLSFPLTKIALKYELMIKKTLKETDIIFGVLSTFNLGA